MLEDGPGIQDRLSSMVSTLGLERTSKGKVDEELSWLAVLFLSADLSSVDEEGVVRLEDLLIEVVLPDEEIDDFLAVVKEHF